MSHTVIIDAFDTQEQAVAFVDWLKKKTDQGSCQILTTQGLEYVQWDGVDTNSSDADQTVVNICTYEADE